MGISQLLDFTNIVIQCHDNPDADALGAGFALYQYLESGHHSVRLCYGGEEISQPQLMDMIDLLEIPVEHCENMPECDLLITVDFQYGAKGCTKWESENIAVIDHHAYTHMPENICFMEIRSHYGSCSTVVWSLICEDGMEKKLSCRCATALYYGLYTDTAGFSEISYPVDRDMRDGLNFDYSLFLQLINRDMSEENQMMIKNAVANYHFDRKNSVALTKVESGNGDLLSIVADFLASEEKVSVAVAYAEKVGGIRISVRSRTNEVRADDLAEYICNGAGSGGGQSYKAGGFLSEYLLDKESSADYQKYLLGKISDYYSSFRIISAADFKADLSRMNRYVKKKVKIGTARLSDFLRAGTPVMVRTLEGDLDCVSADDLYIMVGIDGEVYPIREEKFLATYEFCDGKPEISCEYEPIIHNTLTGEVYPISDYMRTCCAKGTSSIYAIQVEENIKVFTQWDSERYLRGQKGDYLAVREDDISDVYMIQGDIFHRSYERS